MDVLSDTRVFFVVDSFDTNEELFETYEQAREHSNNIEGRVRVCLVRNAYKDNNQWTYDDRYDTFTPVKEL